MKLPTNIDELKASKFKVFMTLAATPMNIERMIFAKHNDEPESVFIFYWDGIHHFDRIDTYWDSKDTIHQTIK